MKREDATSVIYDLQGRRVVHERDGSSQSEAAEPSAFCVLFVLTVQQSRIYGLQL